MRRRARRRWTLAPTRADAVGGGGGLAKRWAAKLLAGGDAAQLDLMLEGAKEANDAMALGARVLARDLRRDVTALARGRADNAARERLVADGVASAGFVLLWSSTLPWTPLVLPIALKYVDRRFILPRQLSAETDPRLPRLMRRRAGGESSDTV